ncbi:shikimate dehydrogenase [Micromonospora chokoriensis]
MSTSSPSNPAGQHPDTAVGISGTTRIYAVLGDPVAQVRAPAMLNPLFRALSVDAVLVPVLVRQPDLDDVVRGLQRVGNLDGLLVTVPHKIEARRFAALESPAVALSGSTNALRREPDGRWTAENFDGEGFVRGLRAAGIDPAGRRAFLAGAGGAGGAVAAALLAEGVADLAVHDPDEGRVSTLLDRLAVRWPGRVSASAGPDGADLAVNATPLGLNGSDPMPFDPAGLPAGAVVADIIMKPVETALLRAAAAAGLAVHHGHHMLDHQLDLYREFFRLDR